MQRHWKLLNVTSLVFLLLQISSTSLDRSAGTTTPTSKILKSDREDVQSFSKPNKEKNPNSIKNLENFIVTHTHDVKATTFVFLTVGF